MATSHGFKNCTFSKLIHRFNIFPIQTTPIFFLEIDKLHTQPERLKIHHIEDLRGKIYPSKAKFGQAWWCIPITPELGKVSQKDCCEFKTSLYYITRPCLKNKCKIWAIIPFT